MGEAEEGLGTVKLGEEDSTSPKSWLWPVGLRAGRPGCHAHSVTYRLYGSEEATPTGLRFNLQFRKFRMLQKHSVEMLLLNFDLPPQLATHSLLVTVGRSNEQAHNQA